MYSKIHRNQRKLNIKAALAILGAVAVVAVIALVALKGNAVTPTNLFSASNGGSQIERLTEAEMEFMKFITEYRRFYFSKEEYQHRFQIFRRNLDIIKESNSNPENTFKLGINQFADMTQEEFRYYHLNSEIPKFVGEESNLSHVEAPASVNWVAQGKVTPVMNEGQCGACWAIAATGAIEGAYAIKYNLEALSVQQLIDCCGANYGCYGCNGGQMTGAFQYVKDKGQVLASQYPYTGKTEKCNIKNTPTAWNTGYSNVPTNNNDELLKAVALGPVTVAIEADQPPFQMYTSGIINSASCGTNLDFAVLIVGYGTDGNTPYWNCKNQWGASWGEQGYVRIYRNSGMAKGVCGIAMQASYPQIK